MITEKRINSFLKQETIDSNIIDFDDDELVKKEERKSVLDDEEDFEVSNLNLSARFDEKDSMKANYEKNEKDTKMVNKRVVSEWYKDEEYSQGPE